MKIPREEGILRVVQLVGNTQTPEAFMRDFDASEWSYEWAKRCGVDMLRMMHDNTDDEADSFEFIEFSAPVQVEFIAQH
jgi:hypothetical protein